MSNAMPDAPPLLSPLTPSLNLTFGLVKRLASEIESEKLAPGARLPTEQELVNATGVSRTVVREAISALRADGLVITRQGVGAFVSPDARNRPFRIHSSELQSINDVLRVFELRISIETEAAGFAAERRTKRHIAEMKRCLSLMTADAPARRAQIPTKRKIDSRWTTKCETERKWPKESA